MIVGEIVGGAFTAAGKGFRCAEYRSVDTRLTVAASSAQARDVDWKLIGFASIRGKSFTCFYDTRSVTYAGSHPKAWVKCLLTKDLEDDVDPRVVEN
jgi:hypothetical protein